MRRTLICVLILPAVLLAAGGKSPKGRGEDGSVSIEATLLSREEVREAVGSDFAGSYTVLDVRVTPKTEKPYELHPDDFILRSESSGDHGGPLLAGQVAGAGEMVVKRTYGGRSNPNSPAMLDGMKVEMQDGGVGTSNAKVLEVVKSRIITDQTITEPRSGLMFFVVDQPKPRSLALSVTTPEGKLRIQFR